MSEQQQPSPLWAIVELFGHQRIAGRISEQQFGGDAFVRIDVPEIQIVERDYRTEAERSRTIQAHTRTFGAKAIYAINWCDEAAATLAARSIQHEPVNPFSAAKAIAGLPVPERERLTAPADQDDDLPF